VPPAVASLAGSHVIQRLANVGTLTLGPTSSATATRDAGDRGHADFRGQHHRTAAERKRLEKVSPTRQADAGIQGNWSTAVHQPAPRRRGRTRKGRLEDLRAKRETSSSLAGAGLSGGTRKEEWRTRKASFLFLFPTFLSPPEPFPPVFAVLKGTIRALPGCDCHDRRQRAVLPSVCRAAFSHVPPTSGRLAFEDRSFLLVNACWPSSICMHVFAR